MNANCEIINLFIYDSGARFSGEQLKGLLKNQEEFSKYEYVHPSPEEIAIFSIPSIFNLHDIYYGAGAEQLKFKVQVAIYDTGVFSIRFRYQFNGELSVLQKVTFSNDIKEFLNSAAAKERSKIERALSKIAKIHASDQSEAYRFYFINADRRKLSIKETKLIAGLLIDEQSSDMLSDQYVNEVTKRNLVYNDDDILYVGWESAVMVDPTGAYEQELIITEIANAQLLEMRIYDANMTKIISAAEKTIPGVLVLQKRGTLKKLNVQLGNFYGKTLDMLNIMNDTIVGFGEWYLSRLYGLYDEAFKLSYWRVSLESKLEIINNRRTFIADVLRSQWDEILEWIVILLIIVEVVIEVFFLAGIKLA
ncbi:MAG: hypothetical protein M1360_01120 [Candidatus Marsarchaeota archaeon]|jgi:hypothetical protein|nr:hypothetical protein [Candidatus Marsarchaeota archaeon]MCL5418523.1 hypothetical protein [Candidatus Marsarchaeota archaeon]